MPRKAFNFYRSYFEVYKELPDKDKIKFMDALLKRQFYGEEPTELSGLAQFAYMSQKHSIDSQIQGYISKTNTPLAPPSVGGRQGGSKAPSVQEKEKEKGEYTPPARKEFCLYAIEVYQNTLNKSAKPYKTAILNKYESWKENGWKDGNGKHIKNWKTKLRNTIPYLTPIDDTNENDVNLFLQ